MNKALSVNDYAESINLFDDFSPLPVEGKSEEELVDALLIEHGESQSLGLVFVEKRRLLHAKVNTLPPNTLSDSGVNSLNQLLQLELKEKNITDSKSLFDQSKLQFGNTKIAIWQGDITTLKTDAIVNAANNQLLGCWQPLHACIDNAIHTAAGVQLRDDCNTIMQKQGFAEPTGVAKVTRAYNLPSRYVLHTVGPIVQTKVNEQHKADLENAYKSCLDISKDVTTIRSVAFCGISTGVFGYPAEQAAQVAFASVKEWLSVNEESMDLVVFNVFSDKDRKIYESLLY